MCAYVFVFVMYVTWKFMGLPMDFYYFKKGLRSILSLFIVIVEKSWFSKNIWSYKMVYVSLFIQKLQI